MKMKTKIKLILWSFLTILFVWLSSTYALDITSYRSSEVDCITEKLGKNLLWVNWWNNFSSNYFECLYKSINPEDDYFKNYSKKSNTNFFENKKYIYMEWYTYSDFFWSYNPFYIVSAPSSNYKLWKDENGIYVFSVLEKEDKKMYKRMKLKVNGDTPVKISSKRWSNIYKKGIVLDWLQLFTKDGDQMRVASIIDNSYTLDWFSFLNVNWSFRLLDTYKNKMYKYPWLSYDEGKYISKWLFYNLYNIKPYEIYDVVWNLGTDGKFYYEYGKYLNFSLENKKVGTKEDLKIIQQDLKDSLNIIDKENAEYYLWMSPEDLGISSNPDLPKNNNENTGNTVAKNATREEKKSCVAYYTYMRSMSSHSDWCLWEVNKDMSDTRLDYWWAISTDWDLSKFGVWDKTKYRRCWHWNNYKEGVKKTLWEKWPAFWKDRQTNYIATEAKDIDVNALCSHIVVWSQINSWGLTFDNFSKAIEWTFLSRGDTVWTLNWVSVPKNVFERDYALMMRYEIACKDKVRLPTEYDNTFSDLLLFKTFWDDNNKNVCKKAEELKEKFKEKYKDLIFTKNYEKAFKSDFWEDSVSSSWTVVVEKALSWSIDKALKVKSLSGLGEKTAWALVDYFTKDYTDWYNKGFSLLGWKGCGAWIWVKEWDYIMRLFLFMILIWLVWKS